MDLSPEEQANLERALLGPDSTSNEAPLEWTLMVPDNLLVRSLKDMAGLFAHSIKKEVEKLEKDVKKAKKVFYGR